MYYEQPRNKRGMWVRGYSKIKLVLWFGGVVLSVSLVAYLYDTIVKANTIIDEYISEPILCEVCAVDKLPYKIAELKSQLLADLAKCENGKDDGMVIIDSGSQLSWGKYMWFRPTIQKYVKLLYGKDIDLREAGIIALNAHSEIPLDELTERAIFEANAIFEWKNCDKKLGLKSRIDIINQLSK